MNYSSLNGAMWDIAQAPSQFSQLPDDDFLALIHNQFSPTDANDLGNTQQSPPSDDSSPSPPSNTDAASRRQSIHVRSNDAEDATLKRKASSDDMDPGPSSKNQHTDDGSPSKKPQPAKRKSTGGSHDESRLLKRKEQNRAAQRAFRERKEKHVKDLEDKVAALEAKNEATETENSNLRDLLSRLQQENLALKQAQFTFSVPKPPAPSPSSAVQPSSFSFFGTPSPFPPPTAPAQAPSKSSPLFGTDIDWGSLTTFDPSMLSVLDEPPDVPMQTDTTQSPFGQYALPQSYKTIANNPLLMSFADESPLSSNTTSSVNSFDQFAFNFSSSPHSWTSSAHSPPYTQNNAQTDFLHPNHSLDELFGGNFTSNQGPLDFGTLVDNASLSPVQQRESPTSASESTSCSSNGPEYHPITLSRSDLAKRIAEEGLSPFSDLANPSLQKTSDLSAGDLISCRGSKFPRTKESPDNIEALQAWRRITQDPHFKNADINELCTEFTKKARCDGTKVVLEPESVHQLFEKFKNMPQRISTQQPQLVLSSS